MSDGDRKLLEALACMAAQYLTTARGEDAQLESSAMQAGEKALVVLEQHGMVTIKRPGSIRADWTEAGQELLGYRPSREPPKYRRL